MELTTQRNHSGFWESRRLGNGPIAVLLAVITIALLLVTARDIGLTWDEPVYIEASQSYLSWFGVLARNPGLAMQAQTVQQYWELNHEHPPFDKIWSGIFYHLTRFLFDDVTAHRFGNILLAGMLVGLIYWLVAPRYGKVAGLGAAGALLTMPRFFFHSHLAALDVPTTVTIVLVCFVFWHSLDRPGLRWTLLLGLVYGIAISTKINGLIEIPLILFFWMVLFRRRLYIFARLVFMELIGLILWVITWPWLYFDTSKRILDYFDFLTVHHYQIAQWYRGHMYLPPPWHYPFVMSLAVIPLTLTILAGTGLVQIVRGWRKNDLGWLLVAFTLFPVLLLAFRLTGAFDDERLLMPAFPFIAAISGIGFSLCVQGIQRLALRRAWFRWRYAFTALLVVVAFVPQIIVASAVYPHLLSYYSETVGTLPVAVKLGFENTYWAETYYDALPYLNANVPSNAMVWVEAHDVMLYYQHLGLLRKDLRIASLHGGEGIVPGTQGYTDTIDHADYAVIEFRESGFMKAITDWISVRTPVSRITYQEVPLLQIYKK